MEPGKHYNETLCSGQKFPYNSFVEDAIYRVPMVMKNQEKS